jgi:hypothetical protein
MLPLDHPYSVLSVALLVTAFIGREILVALLHAATRDAWAFSRSCLRRRLAARRTPCPRWRATPEENGRPPSAQ